MNSIKKADYFWAYQKARVEWIAAQHDIDLNLDNELGFLYELFDNGEAELSDEEIWTAIENSGCTFYVAFERCFEDTWHADNLSNNGHGFGLEAALEVAFQILPRQEVRNIEIRVM